MPLHITVLGIDGSGKSTVTAALPALLAAETRRVVGAAGELVFVAAAAEDHLAPGFYPEGLPLGARLAGGLKKLAKRFVDRRSLYPAFKLAQMMLQDHAARRIAERYGVEMMISDGNTLLSATGRAGNYRRPASEKGFENVEAPGVHDLKAVFGYILEEEPIPEASRRRLPPLRKGRLIYRLTRALGLDAVWLPDAVVFLDLSPALAVERIASRGAKVDRHENPADLAQAREMYLKTLAAYQAYRPQGKVLSIPVDGRGPGPVLGAVVKALTPLAEKTTPAAVRKDETPLGTTRTELSGGAIWIKVLSARYLFRYLLPQWFRGAWREPTFIVSELGRLFRREGYSAGVMRAIYDRDHRSYGFWDRCFLEYPLHRAVYDRLQILTRRLEEVIGERLQSGDALRIFTAPSGFSYDLFRPLEAMAARSPESVKRVQLVAADLDPNGALSQELRGRAQRLGVAFEFLRGDLTTDELRQRASGHRPFDLALFVGISSWMPKPDILRHLRWLRQHLKDDGLLFSDCFTADGYALSGRYVGYKASYFTPGTYCCLLDACGFHGWGAEVVSGRDAINHVVVASPRRESS